jgi:hypothetical protein
MFSNLNIKNKIMSNKMIIGAFIFVGYIYGINYFLRNSLFNINDTDTESSCEIESERSDRSDRSNEENKGKSQDIQMEEIECKINENENEIECNEIECKENENEIECEIECEINEIECNENEIECNQNECENQGTFNEDVVRRQCTFNRCRKTKLNLRTLFEKKRYMVELDRELANIKDRLEDIRNNLHKFN